MPKGERGLAAEGTARAGIAAASRRRRRPASTSAATAASASAPTGAATRATRPTSSRTARASKRRPTSSSTSTTRAPSAAIRTSRWRVVLVPAFAGGDLFHYSGDFTSHIAIRNAYAETQNLGLRRAAAVGRLAHVPRRRHLPVRLLAARQPQHRRRRRRATSASKFDVALHAGLNRLNDLYQYETLDTPPRGLGPPGKSTVLDRPRFVSSLKLTAAVRRVPRRQGRALRRAAPVCPPASTPIRPRMLKTALPSDVGWVVGAQLGGWLRPYVFANLWLRAAGGLAAYGELTVPTGLDPTRARAVGARGRRRALGQLGVAAGSASWAAPTCAASTTRRRGDFNPQSYTEGIIAVRPHIYWNEYFHTAVELSYQARQADGVDFVANRVLTPQVFRFSVHAVGGAARAAAPTSRPQIYLDLHGVGDERRRAHRALRSVRLPLRAERRPLHRDRCRMVVQLKLSLIARRVAALAVGCNDASSRRRRLEDDRRGADGRLARRGHLPDAGRSLRRRRSEQRRSVVPRRARAAIRAATGRA